MPTEPKPVEQLVVTEPNGPDSLGGGVLYLPPAWIGRRVIVVALAKGAEE